MRILLLLVLACGCGHADAYFAAGAAVYAAANSVYDPIPIPEVTAETKPLPEGPMAPPSAFENLP